MSDAAPISDEERTRGLVDPVALARWMDARNLPGKGSPVELRFMHEVAAEFTVGVVREGEGWTDAEARAARKAAAEMQQEG